MTLKPGALGHIITVRSRPDAPFASVFRERLGLFFLRDKYTAERRAAIHPTYLMFRSSIRHGDRKVLLDVRVLYCRDESARMTEGKVIVTYIAVGEGLKR